MRIAVVSPYPLHERAVGGARRVRALVSHLAPRHQVLVLAASNGDRDADLSATEDAAALGAEQVVFPVPRPTLARKLRWALAREPYFVSRARLPALTAALSRRASDLDLIHVEFAYLAPQLSDAGPGPVRVLAEQETMSLAVERLKAVPWRQRRLYETLLLLQIRKIRAFERSALQRFDRVYGITELEAARLREVAGASVGVLPHVVDTQAFCPAAEEPASTSVLFVGNFAHRPNAHALSWFLASVWPQVRREAPEALLHVVGAGSERSCEPRAGVVLHGRVEDLAGAYRAAAVVVNPVQTGSGMRGKVLEAFACARPVVSTGMGLEGIAARTDEHCLAADAPRPFAAATLRYLADPSLRRRHGLLARALVEQRYDQRGVFAGLEADYERLVAARRAAR